MLKQRKKSKFSYRVDELTVKFFNENGDLKSAIRRAMDQALAEKDAPQKFLTHGEAFGASGGYEGIRERNANNLSK